MKDFIKWLGVNEKVAKIAVWMFIIMAFLVMTNTMLDSLGFPYYKITAENIIRINTTMLLEYITSWLITLLNFYSIVFLIFKIKEFKSIFKYSILYLILNILINSIFNYIILQIFIVLYILIFSYSYSKKNWKYVLYAILSIILNTTIQFIWYTYKAQFIGIESISYFEKSLLAIDCLIISAIIISIKEIYLKNKGSDKKCLEVGSGLENSTKKKVSQKKLQKN